MELKLSTTSTGIVKYILFIAPLWNWNFSEKTLKKIGVNLFIAPLWNWNLNKLIWVKVEASPLYSTIMELKPLRKFLDWNVETLFIAPLWNWNWFRGGIILGLDALYSTIMELKLICSVRPFLAWLSL